MIYLVAYDLQVNAVKIRKVSEGNPFTLFDLFPKPSFSNSRDILWMWRKNHPQTILTFKAANNNTNNNNNNNNFEKKSFVMFYVFLSYLVSILGLKFKFK